MSVDKIKNNLGVFGSSVKDTLTHHKQFNNDDELISHYKHDIKKAISALKFVDKQTRKLGSSHWPRLLKSNIKMGELFIKLIGADSLQFDGIEDYYSDFDKWQAEQEIPMIHPKERHLVILSVNKEMDHYMMSMEKLKIRVISEWEFHAKSVNIRVKEMVGYLNDLLKLIKKRNSKKSNYDNIHKKINKIMKKTTPLDAKEQKQLNKLDEELKEASIVFNKLDEKLKSILPHALTFLDEFVENLTKLTLCKQLDAYEDIKHTLMHYATFHGFLDTESEDNIQTYEAITNQWETLITPTRLRIESFVSFIQEKKPELIDTEIDDKDKTSKTHKMWNKVTSKVTNKTHNLKSTDHVNGIFNDYLTTDPLDSFRKFQDPMMNRSETYHPSKVINIDDVIVPNINAGNASAPPPLPPRSNTTTMKNNLKAPVAPGKHHLKRIPSNDSMESIHSSSSESDDDEMTSVSSAASDVMLEKSSPEMVNKDLKKIYNSSKNKIKECPIPIVPRDYKAEHENSMFSADTSSVTYKLEQLNKFFDKILNYTDSTHIERKILQAKYNFAGVEPGDLSFKEGDQVEILFDFQAVDSLYNSSNDNWLVGMIKSEQNCRIGFVPNNYF
ncbi:unnamed protein product [Debaryomyces tyrocola]|nr:unnamed protein product [Debaryomyces tyrocola]